MSGRSRFKFRLYVAGDAANSTLAASDRYASVVGPRARIGAGNMLDHGLRVGAGETIPPGAVTFA